MQLTQEITQQYNQLKEQILHHNDLYYNESSPEITDFEFDRLLKDLERFENAYPELLDTTSPTVSVGKESSKGFVQRKHVVNMLSLENSYSKDDINHFLKKTSENVFEYCIEPKFDGCAISLRYTNGSLVEALTRGNGEVGDDVLENVKTIQEIPKRIFAEWFPNDFIVYGEVYMSLTNFNKLNTEQQNQGGKLYSNPRNTASGTLKLHDPKEVKRRGLSCYVYGLNIIDNNTISGQYTKITKHSDSLAFLKNHGLPVFDFKVCNSLVDIENYIALYERGSNKRNALDFDIDGIVIKHNLKSEQESLGSASKYPHWAIAYKYPAEKVSTLLQSISYQTGRTGAITPVANLAPVQIAGTVVKRASIYNSEEIVRLDLHENDYVFIEKSAEIIPKIVSVDLSKRQKRSNPIVFATHCASCGSELVKNDEDANHYCENTSYCKPQIIGKIQYFVSKPCLDIDAMGEQTVENLYDAGLIKDYTDIYNLTENDLLTLPHFGDRAAERLLLGIENSKTMPYQRVLQSIGIPNVGKGGAKRLCKVFNSIDELMNANTTQLEAIDDIGKTTAESIVSWFQDSFNQNSIAKLKAAGLQFENDLSMVSKPIVNIQNDFFTGKNFVISGTFDNYERDALKEKIEIYGGKIQSGVNSKTNFLVSGISTGPSKKKKAEELSVTIIEEKELEKMF